MSTKDLKENIHALVENINDDVLLQALFALLQKTSKEELSDEMKSFVAEGLASYNSGKTYSNDYVKEQAKKKYPNLFK